MGIWSVHLVLRRGNPKLLLETGAEITDIIISHHVGHLRDGKLAGFNEFGCLFEPHHPDQFHRLVTGNALDLLVK